MHVREGRPSAPAHRLILVGALLALLSAGCGGEGPDDESALRAAVPAPSISRSHPATGGGGKISATEFCAAVTKAQPELDREKESGAAIDTLTARIATLYGEQGATPEQDGRAMDDMGEARCPDAVAKALKAAGITSFTAL